MFLRSMVDQWIYFFARGNPITICVLSELPLLGEPVLQKAGGEFRTIYYIGNRGGLMYPV